MEHPGVSPASPVSSVAQTQKAGQDTQDEADLLQGHQPVLTTHQVPLATHTQGTGHMSDTTHQVPLATHRAPHTEQGICQTQWRVQGVA